MNRLLLQRMIAAGGLACVAWVASAPSSLAQGLTLLVEPVTGAVTISNQSFTSTFALDAYQITSVAGSLAPDPTNTPGANWDSLTDAGLTGWEEVSATANALSELNLSSSTSLVGGGSRSLGKAFVPSGTHDLEWGYSIAGGTPVKPAAIVYTDSTYLLVHRLLGAGGVVEGYAAVIFNPSASSVALDAYAIRSPSGSLNPAGFNGYDGQNVTGWESVAPSINSLSELNLPTSSIIGAGKQQVLGSLFTDQAAQDLSFQYHELTAGTVSGPVLYKTVLSGDVNEDNKVDIFDINAVSSNWNTSGPTGDANFDGIVDIFDINAISSHWNNMLGGGGSSPAVTPVPEPSGLLLCGLAAATVLVRYRRGRRH